MRKKGQVTVFIILAIVMIISAALFIYVRYSGGISEEEKIPRIKEVPVEFQPINGFIENCLTQVATDALEKIGQRGGYIDPVSHGIATNYHAPTEADAVSFGTGSDLIIPYWYYLKSENTCSGTCLLKHGRPNLYRSQGEPSIEGQIDRYVAEKFGSCLANRDELADQGYTVSSTGLARVETNVFARDVGIYIEHPVVVTRGDRTHTLQNFFVRIPVRLKEIYSQATQLTNLESQYKYLESHFSNLIVAYSRLDPAMLPPMARTDFDFGPGVMWSEQVVKLRVQELLAKDMQLLQVQDSLNWHNYNTGKELGDGLYNIGMLITVNQSYPDFEVAYSYLDFWPIYFSLNCPGAICRPESISRNIMALFGMQSYKHLYDVSFPVMVTISDPAALNYRGYDFQFMLEANFRDNNPMNRTYVALVSEMPGQESMLCDIDNRNSGNITVTVTDSIADEGLDKAEVVYSCGEESCSIGKTEKGTLSARFPVCMGGIASVLKPGYIGKARWLNTRLAIEDTLSFELAPILEINMTIQKYSLVKTDSWRISSVPYELEDGETAVLSLTRMGKLGEEGYSTFKEYKPSDGIVTISLAPGEYKVSLDFLLNKKIIIQPEKKEFKSGLFSKKTMYVPPTPMTIDEPVAIGGLNGNYTFLAGDIAQGEITIYGCAVEIGKVADPKLDDLNLLSQKEQFSTEYKDLLAPRFS
ncbi:MAG: hypothetical protein ABIF10_03485 [Candidatus Woesearchaeota archaeon]